jgi:molybdate transport system ATP-binding protein
VSAVLALRGIRHGYGAGFTLDVPSLDVFVGEVLAVIGPNGSGKSTLLRVLGLLERPTAGLVLRGGRAVDARDALAERRRMAMVFQEPLLADTTVAANVALGLGFRGIAGHEIARRVAHWLERFGIAALASRPARTLSGGEAQRVALARAIVHRPKLLLLDEPSSGLDVRGRAELRPVLMDTLATFSGVRVLVTHDPVEAMTLADRVVILERGRVTQQGTFDDVRRTPGSRYAAELAGVNLFAGRLEPLDGGAGRLVTAEGDVVVGWPEDLPRLALDDVTGTLRPSDVVVHAAAPGPISARNVWRGAIEDLAIYGERVRVRIASQPPLVAEVTVGSMNQLGLVRGTEVWASFKAVEVEISLGAHR